MKSFKMSKKEVKRKRVKEKMMMMMASRNGNRERIIRKELPEASDVKSQR